jgi:hypothetical protein
LNDLFVAWRRSVDTFSRRAVAAYTRELPDYRRFLADPRRRAEMVDFSIFVRARTVEVVAEGGAFTSPDLDVLVGAGRDRGAAGISAASHRHALALHASLTLREVHDAARVHDVEDLMRTLRALPVVGSAAQAAFTRGFLQGQRNNLSLVERVRALVELVFAGDAMASALADDLAMGVPAQGVVLVGRTVGDPPREAVLAELLSRHWIPLSWQQREFVALIGPSGSLSARERALVVARDLSQLAEVPCAVGAAEGDDLAAALVRARQVCAVAPLSGTLHYPGDVFASLAVARVPVVDEWLRELVRRLDDGPDLTTTLDAFYRNGMGRTLTAAELRIHPRTLDYRLRRVQELTELDAGSVRGVRILSTAVARVLSGGWG